MDCEYINRCANSDKCYRCFNHQLLKLPEDKRRGNLFDRAKTDIKKSNSDNSWEDLEQTVADKLNKVPNIAEARRSRASGALPFEKGDVVDEILHPECKERKGRELKTGDKSMSIKKSWLEKTKEECKNTSKYMALPFRFKNDTSEYVIMDFDDLASLVTDMKAYMRDNEIKRKELELLQKKLQ